MRYSGMEPPVPEPTPPLEPKFPGTITAAGIIWVIAGILLLLGGLAGGSIPSIYPERERLQRKQGLYVCGGGFVGLLGILFLIGGVSAVRGRARGLLSFGMLSIIVGIPTSLCYGVGAALVVAGILALVGRAEYERRRTRGMPRGWEPPHD
jgi:hypothetical protein